MTLKHEASEPLQGGPANDLPKFVAQIGQSLIAWSDHSPHTPSIFLAHAQATEPVAL